MAFFFNIIKQYVFWMLFFILNRTVFILYNYRELKSISFSEILDVFYNAIYLDTSMACYILAIPFVLLFLQSLIKLNFINNINRFYSFIIIVVIAIITSSELGIYEEWGIKLNFKAISYLSRPDEVFNSAKLSVIIIGFILILFQSAIGIWFYNKFIHRKLHLQKRNYLFSILFLIITPIAIILGLRGGLQQIPINQSDVCFSKKNFLNTSAVNSLWNLMHSIDQNKEHLNKNPFVYYDINEAKKQVDLIHITSKDTTVKIFNTEKPNIVLIILESWSADLIYSLGGYEGITPEFEKLIGKGLLFTNNYAPGALSHHAMSAIFSAFPGTPSASIIKEPSKFHKLPCFVTKLQKKGYYSSFHFGGQLNYGNIRSYMYYNQFDEIIEGKDFSDDIPNGKLGVHDEYLYNRFIKDLNTYQEPFFSSAFTLSSHSPYDQPMKEVLHWGDKEKDFINSVYYADSCLGNYFAQAKKQDWYKNTLFILVSDHSHNTPRNRHRQSLDFRKIPMLFYGDVLKDEYKGKRYNEASSQSDISATLLGQLGLDYKDFKWSKNLFNPYASKFAYYYFGDGLGWVTDDGYFVYDHNLDKMIFKHFQSEEAEKQMIFTGKSYLQVLFQEFLDY